MSRTTKPPERMRVLIAGGGVAGVETLLALRALAGDRVDLELLAPETHFWYRPLAVAEPFGSGRVQQLELAGITRAAGASFILGALTAVDAKRHLAVAHNGLELRYDVLVLACGAKPEAAFEDGLTFRGPADSDAFSRLLARLEAAPQAYVVFVVPGGAAWPLPAYELALQTAARVPGLRVTLVTPETRPLTVFGPEASGATERLLADRGVDLRTGTVALGASGGVLRVVPDGELRYDHLVSIPRLRAVTIDGLSTTGLGFVPTDDFGRVRGLDDVYAAGDLTTSPVKHGGLAAQQADSVASSIASRAGAPVRPEPFRPVLRALLLSGGPPTVLQRTLAGASATEPLSEPPTKVVARYLTPFLAEHAELTAAGAT
jgi:sulfide:quinone oxidoreductase